MYKKLKIIVPIILLVIFITTQYFTVFQQLDNIIHDNILASSREPASNIIIVGMDERSMQEIGMWPWPRYFIAETISRLEEMDPAVIGISVRYDLAGAVPEYDQMLIDAASASDRLVFAGEGILSPFQDSNILEIENFILPIGDLGLDHVVGFVNDIADGDGVMRRSLTSFSFGDIRVHSFPYEVYRMYRNSMGQVPIADVPLDSNGQFPIRYVGGPETFRAVSLWGVLHGEYPDSWFKDAIVLVGIYAPGAGDVGFQTPLNHRIPTHRVEIYANVVQNFLEGTFLVDAAWWVNTLVLLVVAAIITVVFVKLKPLPSLIITILIMLTLLFGARITYDYMYAIIRVSDVLVFVVTCYMVNIIVSILSAQNDRQEIKALFGRFVSPEVVNEIIAGGADLQLGGVIKDISALFVDIRGFTAFSEANPPEKVVDMVNRYLELTSRSIQQNSGTIDKFIGDATMALFNAPHSVPDHALCAVKAAWAMKVGAAPLREEILAEYGVDLQFGIGVNTGAAVVGNMGSDFRMDYTAIGDTINTAARLESSALKGQIIISDATYQLVKDHVEVTELGSVNFKNKSVGVLIYSVENVIDGGKNDA